MQLKFTNFDNAFGISYDDVALRFLFDQHWEFGVFDHLKDDFDMSVRFGRFDD